MEPAFARTSIETDFTPRHGLDSATLIDLLGWNEATFLKRTEGMALRRVNFSQWVRNLAVAAGNAESSTALKKALRGQRTQAQARSDEMCLEHLEWALNQLESADRVSKNAHDRA